MSALTTATNRDRDILAALGYPDAEVIGEGGEVIVYGLTNTDVLRLLKPGASDADDTRAIATALPEPSLAALVHLDMFSGNIL